MERLLCEVTFNTSVSSLMFAGLQGGRDSSTSQHHDPSLFYKEHKTKGFPTEFKENSNPDRNFSFGLSSNLPLSLISSYSTLRPKPVKNYKLPKQILSA